MTKPTHTPCYVIISPVRNEERNIEATIRSVAGQTVVPQEWVIVDDGSTDRTAEVVKEYARRYPWVKLVRQADRGHREPGTGVIAAFEQGYAVIQNKEWDYVVKLDGDLAFDSDYFAECFSEFEKDAELGVGGGIVFHKVGTRDVVEPCPQFHVRGATKIYRRACWEQIGGLLRAPGWDTLDEVKANMLGWTTRSFPRLRLLHLRPTGAADGAWKNAVKNGRANYIAGYHPLFMLLKCVKRILEKPYGIGAAGLLWGFSSAYWKRIPQVSDKELIRYLRGQQMNYLRFQSSLWSQRGAETHGK